MGVVEPHQTLKPEEEEAEEAVRFLARILRLLMSTGTVETAVALLIILHGILGWTGHASLVDVSNRTSWEEVPALASAYDGSPTVLAAANEGIAPRLAGAYDGIRPTRVEDATNPMPRGAPPPRTAAGGCEVVASTGGAYDGVTSALAASPDSPDFRDGIPVPVLAVAHDGMVPNRSQKADDALRVLASAYDGTLPVSLSAQAALIVA